MKLNMFWWRRIVIASALLTALFLCGCGGSPVMTQDKVAYTVKDYTGAEVSFAQKPTRIISASVSTDEILMDLVSQERIAALTYLADDPGISCVAERAKSIKGRIRGENAEGIMAFQPDLVIVPDFVKAEAVQSLRDLGLKVYVYKTAKNFSEIRQSIIEIGAVVKEERRAAELVHQMDAKLKEIRDKIGDIPDDEQKRVVLIRTNGVYYSPKSSFSSICRGAIVTDATSVLHRATGFLLSEEEIVKLDPDVFVVMDWNYDGKNDAREQVKMLLENPSYRTTKAVRNNSVVILPSAHILALSHYVTLGVEELARAVYPEKF